MYFVVEKIHIESGDITKIPMAGSPKLKLRMDKDSMHIN